MVDMCVCPLQLNSHQIRHGQSFVSGLGATDIDFVIYDVYVSRENYIYK